MRKMIIVFLLSFTIAKSQKIDVTAYAMNGKTNVQEPVAQVFVEEFLNEKIYALLNYVFFEENSAEIPKRYKQFEKKYEIEYFNPSKKFINYEVLDVYYQLLNIVASRMTQYKDEAITLKASNSSKESEKDNIDLANKRLQAVKKYLVDIWSIPENRIQLDNNNGKPSVFSSNSKNEFGEEENRRVEIIASWNILQPLYISDTVKKANPPTIYFRNKIQNIDSIKKYNLTVKQNSKLFKFKGTNAYGKPKDILEWRLNKDKDMPTETGNILYRNSVMSNKLYESDMKKLPIKYTSLTAKKQYRIKSKEFKRFNLLLFDFGSSEVKNYNSSILELIKKDESLKRNSLVYISGYTDTLGNDGINKNLSIKRAESVKEKMLSLNIPGNYEKVEGVGEIINPYKFSILENVTVAGGVYVDPETDYNEIEAANQFNYNTTPEGRFYCRTVIIEVENTIGD